MGDDELLKEEEEKISEAEKIKAFVDKVLILYHIVDQFNFTVRFWIVVLITYMSYRHLERERERESGRERGRLH